MVTVYDVCLYVLKNLIHILHVVEGLNGEKYSSEEFCQTCLNKTTRQPTFAQPINIGF